MDLGESVQEPMQRLDVVDDAINDLRFDIKNRATLSEMFQEL